MKVHQKPIWKQEEVLLDCISWSEVCKRVEEINILLRWINQMCISSCGLGLDQNIASRIGEYDKMIQLNDDWDYDTVRWTHFFCMRWNESERISVPDMGYIYNVPVDSTMRQLLNCSSYIARVNFYKYNTARISARTHTIWGRINKAEFIIASSSSLRCWRLREKLWKWK